MPYFLKRVTQQESRAGLNSYFFLWNRYLSRYPFSSSPPLFSSVITAPGVQITPFMLCIYFIWYDNATSSSDMIMQLVHLIWFLYLLVQLEVKGSAHDFFRLLKKYVATEKSILLQRKVFCYREKYFATEKSFLLQRKKYATAPN